MGQGGKKTMATVPSSLSSLPVPACNRNEASIDHRRSDGHRSIGRQEGRWPFALAAVRQTEMPFRSFQHRPLRQQVPQLSRKAKLRCVVAQCVCVCAGRHSWWWPGGRAGEQRRAGRRPSGRPPIAFGRGRGIDCCRTHAAGPGRGKKKKKSEERSFRGQHVRTYSVLLRSSTRTGRQQQAPWSESCLPVDRSDSIAALVHASCWSEDMDRQAETARGGSAAAERDAPSSAHRVGARQAPPTAVLCLFCHWNSPCRRRQTDRRCAQTKTWRRRKKYACNFSSFLSYSLLGPVDLTDRPISQSSSCQTAHVKILGHDNRPM